MNLTENQIKAKKRVGRIGSNPVVELITKGGLHMIVAAKSGGFETLGVGSHRAVARHIAGQKADITWTELSKADPVAAEHFAHILPKYEALTEQIRAAQGRKE
jgi:isocitrate lyase